MASFTLNEIDLFGESDNENESTIVDHSKRKRKRCISDKGAVGKACKDMKNINSTNSAETNLLWSIKETLFYPLGIRNHFIVGANKSILLIWSDLSVINFVIKKNPIAKQTLTTRIRIDISDGEQIKDIQVLQYNTLLLLESGRVNYFSSSKSMHALKWIANVRCIAVCLTGFSIIRLTTERKLVLEIYEDVVDMGKNTTGPLKHKYDITFDEQNLFNCGWEDEHYYLLSVDLPSINENNIKFLQVFTRKTFNSGHQKELHLFAISGNVFLLIPDVDTVTYQIEMLFSYSSNVAIIKLDFQRNFCFIFLQCGVIDVWYMSSKYQHLLHQTYNIGSEYTSFSYSESRAALYFTDGNKVAEFRFFNLPENEELVLHETYKVIPGVLVCTWVEAIEQLVCLDCNNIFHQLSFETSPIEDEQLAPPKAQLMIKTAEFEKFNTLFELTPKRVTKLLEKAHVIQQLNELPKMIYRNIEQQYQKQELLAVSSKNLYYSTLLDANLEFGNEAFHCVQNNVVPLYTRKHFLLIQRTLLALIHVKIKSNEIFHNSFWQLYLQFEGFNHIFTLPKNLLKKELCIIVPLEMSSEKLLPEFRLHLYTFVSCAQNYVAIALPISIAVNYDSLTQLFITGKFSYIKSLNSNYTLEDLLRHFSSQPKFLPTVEIKSCLSVPKSFKLKSVFKTSQDDALICDENKFQLSFLGSKISVCYNAKENIIDCNCDNAAPLFYIKMYLQAVCEQQSSKCDTENYNDDLQKILRSQCSVEQLYTKLQDVDNDDLNEKPYMVEKMKLLKELYLKIRKEIPLPLCL